MRVISTRYNATAHALVSVPLQHENAGSLSSICVRRQTHAKTLPSFDYFAKTRLFYVAVVLWIYTVFTLTSSLHLRQILHPEIKVSHATVAASDPDICQFADSGHFIVCLFWRRVRWINHPFSVCGVYWSRLLWDLVAPREHCRWKRRALAGWRSMIVMHAAFKTYELQIFSFALDKTCFCGVLFFEIWRQICTTINAAIFFKLSSRWSVLFPYIFSSTSKFTIRVFNSRKEELNFHDVWSSKVPR